MKNYRTWIACSLCIALGFMLAGRPQLSGEERDQRPTKWEYKIVALAFETDEERDESMRRNGLLGWELAAVTPVGIKGVAYFKRPFSGKRD